MSSESIDLDKLKNIVVEQAIKIRDFEIQSHRIAKLLEDWLSQGGIPYQMTEEMKVLLDILKKFH